MTPLSVLAIVSKPRKPDNSNLYFELTKYFRLDVVYLNKKEQKYLFWYLRKYNLKNYDVVYTDLFFKCLKRQIWFLKKINNLWLLEEDACQNYIESSKWYGDFVRFYKKLPGARVLVTGHYTALRLQKENLNALYVPKGYDSVVIKNNNLRRDIELGYIGSLNNNVYSERKEFLNLLEEKCNLKIMKTKPGVEYASMLNRIRFFISADIGLNEYMIKNFEAMGAGCILCTFRQGHGEEECLKLEDMNNVVLYSTYAELIDKLEQIKSSELLQKKIVSSSVSMAERYFSYKAQARVIAKHITEALRS